MITFFTLLFFDCSTLFFMNEFSQNLSESIFLHIRILINSFVFIRRAFIKWEQNNITKLRNIITTNFNALTQNNWFKAKSTESTERWKTSFPKETVEYADLHDPALNNIMTTQEKCLKYDFVAPLKT